MKHLKKILIIAGLIIPFIGIMMANRWIDSQVKELNSRDTLLPQKTVVLTAVKPSSTIAKRPVIDPATDPLAPRVRKTVSSKVEKPKRKSSPVKRYEISSDNNVILTQ